MTEECAYPFWHQSGSGYWHYYPSAERSACGNWHLIDWPIPADATKQMPQMNTEKVCKACRTYQP